MGWSVSGHMIDFTEEFLKAIQKKKPFEDKETAGLLRQGRHPPCIQAVRNTVNASGIYGYFPIITTDVGLKKIDGMLCEAIRIISTGKRGGGKYRVSYQTIREWDFRSLVSRWYRHLKRGK